MKNLNTIKAITLFSAIIFLQVFSATGVKAAECTRNATSGGYMGGISYQLPQFVGVQYQPKDYTVELDRIINESLFKGMI